MDLRPRRRLSHFKDVAASASRRHKPDYWLVTLSAILMAVGLVVVYSISPALSASQHISQGYFITKQLIAVMLGVVAFILAATVPLDFWKTAAKPLAIVAAVGCALVMVTPINAVYPAHRWIRLGGFSFQVAELIKLSLIIWMAGFLTNRWQKNQLSDFNATLKPLLILLAGVGLIVARFQSDLGSTGVMIAIMGAMAFTAGIPLRRIAIIVGLVGILLVFAIASSPYRRERLTTYLHPEQNCQSSGYQECQALISVGSGGIFGLGLGNSVQAYGYLPEASNDSIFAIIAEKLGFIGTIIILAIYGVFISRLKTIIQRTSDQFNRLVVVGVMAWLSTQMIINVGAMTGLLPLKGITLPLISQGGTSLIFLTAALGLIFQISRYTSYKACEPENSYVTTTKNSSDGRGFGRPYNAAVITRPRT